MNVNRYRGFGNSAEQWKTICSHSHFKHDCKLCQIGTWVKEEKLNTERETLSADRVEIIKKMNDHLEASRREYIVKNFNSIEESKKVILR